MKKKALFLCLILISSVSSIFSQVLPSYKERSILGIRDTSFSTSNMFQQATEGIVDGDTYMIGPGDRLFVSVNGGDEINITVPVNHEGVIYVPKTEPISVKNLTLNDCKKKIENVIKKYYKNVNIFITLAEFRPIKVSLLGDVKTPNTYILYSNSRLIDLIFKSSGLNKTADMRNIRIKKNSGEEKTFDLLSFLRYGASESNPYLTEGDLIIVDKIDKVVSITGMVKYPGVYEYVEGESIYELIKISGGLTDRARLDSIEVISFNENGKNQFSRYFSISELKNRDIKSQKSDMIVIREKYDYLDEQFVTLEGYIKYPGTYKIEKEKTTLKELIHTAGGFKEDASLVDAYLSRKTGTIEYDPEFERLKLIPRADMTEDEYEYLKAKSRQRIGKVVVDFYKLFVENNESENIILKKGDIITVPEKKNYVILLGQVVNPGNIIYNRNYSFMDYINLAGGFGWRAQENEVRIIRANTGEWVDAEDAETIEPGDTIWIPEDPPGPKFWDVFTQSLTILGQVAAVIAATVAVIVSTR